MQTAQKGLRLRWRTHTTVCRSAPRTIGLAKHRVKRCLPSSHPLIGVVVLRYVFEFGRGTEEGEVEGFSVGPLRCLAMMISGLARAVFLVVEVRGGGPGTPRRRPWISIEPDSRKSESCGFLSLRISGPRFSWERPTGTSSSLARASGRGRIPDTSCWRDSTALPGGHQPQVVDDYEFQIVGLLQTDGISHGSP